ncbi:Os04g0177400, partial [Oryza sativa Japonica Group]
MGNLSHAGRAIQINACLSSIPSYAMGFYSLPEGVHHKFDSVRGRYYWAGNKINGKYHMVKWEDMAFPKDFGGLGFTETRAMNIALLAKWIFKLESPDQSLCTSLLRNKYLQEGGVFQCRAEEGSQFWKGVLSTRDWVKLGTEWLVGDGRHILFWKDVWVHPCPLKTSFPLLFEICNQQSILVAEIKQAGIEGLSFRRSFGPREMDEWEELRVIIENISTSQTYDTLRWALKDNKTFTTQSLYRVLTFRGMIDTQLQQLWSAPCPLKIKHFIWLGLRDRIQASANLAKKGWSGSVLCLLCGEPETTKHIIFRCPMATFVWCLCRDVLGWDRIPVNFDDFFCLAQLRTVFKHMNVKLALLAA